MLFCIKKKFCLIEENCFWWVVLWDCFVVDSVFFLHVVASVLAGGKVVQYLIWFEVFFYSFDDFFSMIWWNTITDFFPLGFFVWDFLCLISLRGGRFFFLLIFKKVSCWMDWIVCWLSCRRICFFFFLILIFFFEWD